MCILSFVSEAFTVYFSTLTSLVINFFIVLSLGAISIFAFGDDLRVYSLSISEWCLPTIIDA